MTRARGGNETKRRWLQEIEDQAMQEEDPIKLKELFENYRAEYTKDRDDNEGKSKRQKVQDPPEMQERASGSGQAAAYEEMQVGAIDKLEFDILKVEVVLDDNGECLKTLQGMIDPDMKLNNIDKDEGLETLEGNFEDEFAWDDVNNFPLPLNEVQKARKEDMGHMNDKIFKVVKKE